jgi:hypothetical protein
MGTQNQRKSSFDEGVFGFCVMGLVVFLLNLCSSSGSLVNRTRMFLFDVIICGLWKSLDL